MIPQKESAVAILVKRLAHGRDCALPHKKTIGSSGCDVCAAIEKPLTLQPLQRLLVPTGLCLEIPQGYEVQIRPRSGLALTHGITVLNSPGTIDSDYRGEVQVILINLGQAPVVIAPGDRIAQLVPAQVAQTVTFAETEQLSDTQRGDGGFGHTGQRG
ncbi:MAG: dUTP diphosphatase [Chitinivibrionales bacterium]|nr:dUTP diphosphatase [Chitinivibrionales bacterium]